MLSVDLMKKDRLIEILSAERLTDTEFKEISELVDQYPWFNIARFLKLKAMHQLNMAYGDELEKSVVFSSDRKYLYHWINGDIETERVSLTPKSSELEFLGGLDTRDINSFESYNNQDAFELYPDDQIEEENIDMMRVPVKEESDMEEPDVEEETAFPNIDQIKEIEKREAEEGGLDNISEPVTESNENDIEKGAEKEQQIEPDAEELTPIMNTKILLREIRDDELPVGKEEESNKLIERFINNEPGVIPADKPTELKGDAAAGSVQENDHFITDTLAQIYIKQGLYAKAIYAYERLSLKYPEKSAYFAAQIEKIENISHS